MTGNKKFTLIIAVIILIAGLLVAAGLIYQLQFSNGKKSNTPVSSTFTLFEQPDAASDGAESEDVAIVPFKSAEEFKQYIADSSTANTYAPVLSAFSRTTTLEATGSVNTFDAVDTALGESGSLGNSPSRSSETNVQVLGIDEPDIVKNNGNYIAVSSAAGQYYRSVAIDDTLSDTYNTKLIEAFPVENLQLASIIPESGSVFMTETQLVVMTNAEATSYDITDASDPQEEWKLTFADDTAYHSARMIDGTLYVITNTQINSVQPCPFTAARAAQTDITVPCDGIYHPTVPVDSQETYTAMRIDMESGAIEDSVSVVGGDAYSSSIYMSENALYIALPEQPHMTDIFYDFALTDGKSLFPSDVTKRLQEVDSYELSEAARMAEYRSLTQTYYNSLTEDELLEFENELEQAMSAYYEEHQREFERTIITKVNTATMTIDASGAIPGHTLNQFSFDEYNGNLRVSTTIGESLRFVFGGDEVSVNDVYVLDDQLQILGSVEDMGQGEQIYATRFIGDVGYLVTFRETDPFYVLNLEDPQNPRVEGELKIPGYSSYLHPVAENRILGIGKEGSGLKLSLFDVSNPESPEEIDKYDIKDYGSEALYDHKAFLHDAENELFFLPGYRGGYVFSYEEDTLTLEKAVSDYTVQRALYIDEYLYIVSDDAIEVYDQENWDLVDDLSLDPEADTDEGEQKTDTQEATIVEETTTQSAE